VPALVRKYGHGILHLRGECNRLTEGVNPGNGARLAPQRDDRGGLFQRRSTYAIKLAALLGGHARHADRADGRAVHDNRDRTLYRRHAMELQGAPPFATFREVVLGGFGREAEGARGVGFP